jgi:F-type H+-transporting ATPase subunit b
LEKLGINLGYLIVQILNFGILFLVLKAWVYTPIMNMLDKRREAVAQGLEDAKVAADARANAEQEAQRIITEAQVKANDIIRDATNRAEGVQQELRTAAEAEIAKLRESSKTELETERNLMLSGLRSQVVTLAMASANHLIGEGLKMDQTQQMSLVNEFFSGLKDGKLVLLQDAHEIGTTAEVTSALPLTQDEQHMVHTSLANKAGNPVEVVYHVDPSILGGLIVRVGDRVVDGSIAGQLQELQHQLQ